MLIKIEIKLQKEKYHKIEFYQKETTITHKSHKQKYQLKIIQI